MMTIHTFNTLTRNCEPLIPLRSGKVKMYVCGPTVYDEPHLGHARSAVVYDVVRRYLKVKGYSVTYVSNITDIDDKIIEKARRLNRDYRKLSAYYTHRYREAMGHLNVLRPDAEPKATDFILPIQEFISRLMQAGHAYGSDGDVFFAVPSFKGYGRLSGRHVQAAGDEDRPLTESGKKHPADFALWKAARPGEPSWPSPWGPGRPGWHIECSAMSAGLLGEVFDIHGGGEDLIFPHHENEIAQSESVSGKTPATYWMHNGLVYVNGKKMSKSLGNGLKLNDLIEIHPSGVLRLLLLSKRYRHPMEISDHSMHTATKNFIRLNRILSRIDLISAATTGIAFRDSGLWSRFCSAMDEDFNFPMALSVVFQGVRTIHRNIGNTFDSRGLENSGGLKATVAGLAFICREVLGIKVEPAVRVAAGRWIREETGAAV